MIDPETIIDGRYRVISRVGSGGMAEVYLAQDQLLGREVAVKILHHHFAEDQEFVERFRREASSAAGLSHPNIVGIFDRGEWNGTYYIAMEYVPGRALKAIVREGGPLEPVVAIDIVIQILRAARFAHRRGVIHRDLKPHNVILDEEGRARVTDFGIARAGASDMTLTGSIMGTAQYLSPEQAQGYAVSDSSDLYSVGVILYELLTGAVPFEGETAVAVAFKQVSAEPRPPSELNPLLPASLDAVVLRALAKDPAARYADADELIAALQLERDAMPALAGAALTAVEAQPQYAAPPPAHAATGSLLLADPPTRYGDDDGADPEEARRRRRKRILWALAALAAVALAALIFVLLSSSNKTVTVPEVVGQSEQAAGALIRHAGLSPDPSLASSATVPIGLVISQAPAAGSEAEKGSHVTIVVSGGPASAALISVAGMAVAKAEDELRKAGFHPARKPQASTNVKSGIVIGTEPPAGTELQVGSSVTLLVSSGPAPIEVPDLTGQSRTAAEATLTNAKLAVGSITRQVSSTQAPETVLSQSPTTGTSVHAGETVDLTVAQAPQEAAVPNVVGQSETLAVQLLEGAGFKVKVVSQPTTVSEQNESVLKQSPAGSSKAHKGATVTITVGAFSTPTTTTTTTTTTPPPASPGAPTP